MNVSGDDVRAYAIEGNRDEWSIDFHPLERAKASAEKPRNGRSLLKAIVFRKRAKAFFDIRSDVKEVMRLLLRCEKFRAPLDLPLFPPPEAREKTKHRR
jgi:hypothetical protein